MLPVGVQTGAQSRLRRMQATRCDTSRSDKQASAQAVHVSTQPKHASMQRLMASEWAGFSGCDRNIARTATADMTYSFRPPQQNQPAPNWFRLLSMFPIWNEWNSVAPPVTRNFCDSERSAGAA